MQGRYGGRGDRMRGHAGRRMNDSGELKKRSGSSGSKSGGRSSSSGSSGGRKVSSASSNVSAGKPLSEDAAQELQSQVDDVLSEFEDLEALANFTKHREMMADLDGGISDLQDQVASLRQRGYKYKSFLEGKVSVVDEKWQGVRSQVDKAISDAERDVKDEFTSASQSVSAIKGITLTTGAKPKVAQAESNVSELKRRVESLESAIEAIYGNVSDTFYQTSQQIEEVVWMLDQIDTASFELVSGENPVHGVSGMWWRDGKNKGPEGVLYLTDQRLIFEQREKVATKKVLFVATQKEMVQELVLEAPVTSIEDMKAADMGMFGGQQVLEFSFGTGSYYGDATFRIKGQDNDYWVSLIRRVRNGQLAGERVGEAGQAADPIETRQAAEDAIADAPSQCTACGAPLPMLAAGQRQHQCEFCGSTMRW
ncbi:MAG: hypothetical protein GYB68_18135 [Chloroflexi bacterium]|nr:hypothetical protein [Chloroflexota bacterium]